MASVRVLVSSALTIAAFGFLLNITLWTGVLFMYLKIFLYNFHGLRFGV